MLPKNYTLETARFQLRIPQEEDIPHVFSATTYPGFNDGMRWDPPESIEELKAPQLRSVRYWETGEAYPFTIVKKGDNTLLGRISIRPKAESGVWNVGFWTHPASQNQGIMTEVLAAILKFGFEELGAKRITADYAIWNKASEKVLHKNGMKFVRFVEKGLEKKGKWVAEHAVEISKEYWVKMVKN